jgi:hypothetical protein
VLDVYSFILMLWCLSSFLLFFQGNIQIPNRLYSYSKMWGWGESKCSVFEEQNFERVTVRIVISAVKSLHSLWQQTGISKFAFLFEAFFFSRKSVKARILTF